MSLTFWSYSRVTIENTVEDELLESSIEIRDLDLDVIGRSKVVARNFLAEVSFRIIAIYWSNNRVPRKPLLGTPCIQNMYKNIF